MWIKLVQTSGLLVCSAAAMPRKRPLTSCNKDDVSAKESAFDILKLEGERLTRQRRALQQKEKRVQGSIADVAFILFVWTCPDTSLCHAYLAHQQMTSDPNNLSVAKIQDRYLSAGIDHINAIQDKTDHIGKI